MGGVSFVSTMLPPPQFCFPTDFDSLGLPCTHRTLLDGINLVFALGYLLSLFAASLRKQVPPTSPAPQPCEGRQTSRWRRVLFSAVSVSCAAVGVAHLGLSTWGAASAVAGAAPLLLLAVRGLVWIVLAVSLRCHRSSANSWTQGLISAWWWVLLSVVDLEILALDHDRLQILEMVSWPVSLMLLPCAALLIRQLVLLHRRRRHQYHPAAPETNGLSQPLLNGEQQPAGTTPANDSGIINKAGFLGKLTFSWLNPLLRLGSSKPLRLDDIPDLEDEDNAALAYDRFARAWELQRTTKSRGGKSPNLTLFALASCYSAETLLVALYALLRTVAVVSTPVLLYGFIDYCTGARDIRRGMMLVAALVASRVADSLFQRHWYFNSRRTGMGMRSALMAAVFRKELRLSSTARRSHSTGEIVNYIGVDAYRLGEFPWWFHMAWTSPLQLAFSVAILLAIAGTGATFGLIPLGVCALLNVPIAKILQNCQYQFMAAQDSRLRATSEVLNNIKIVKLQSWEDHFNKAVEALREVEFTWLKKTQINKAYGTALFWISPTVVSAVIFAGCALTGSAPLNASTIFTILLTLKVIAEPVRMLPEVLSVMIQVKVSLDRLDGFLLEDEIEEQGRTVNRRRSPVQGSDAHVSIHDGSFCWDPDDAPPSNTITLRNINLSVRSGQKTAVCGPVGAGKSSILYAILGEIPKLSGTVDTGGTIAYVSQTSWIQSGTLRDNILFGRPMDKERYNNAIKACALDKDIENFNHGDLTEIGQRGLNMSGGQKQRIQLARAVYNDADIYLLDDPFSAVDAHTAAILFNDCVMAALAEKTVILVTHQIEFLPEMDKILVMEGGEITQSGTYQDLLHTGTAFEELVNAHRSTMISTTEVAGWEGTHETPTAVADQKKDSDIKPAQHEAEGNDPASKLASGVQLTDEEEKEIGDMGWKPYLDYIQVPNSWFHFVVVVLFQIGFVSLQMLASYWLAYAVEIPDIATSVLIGVYTILSLFSCLCAHMRSWTAAHLGLRASRAFFSGFMNSVFKAPMLFFDSTPVGRIFSRASSDLSLLDYDLPFAISFAIAGFIEIAITIIVVALVTWQVLLAAIPALIAIIKVQRYYQTSARELVRINGTTKAPVMNYAAETALGVVTIRAFSATDRFIQNNLKLVNADAKLFFHTVASMEWVLLRVEALQNITILATALILVLVPQDSVATGLVGLSLSYALALSATQGFLTRWYSYSENYIISVERIKQFMHLPSEAPAFIDDKRPPPFWPSQGKIDFRDLKIRYRPNAPLVLKGITCAFAAGEKVGVVGRTGSGKTTLISALFRLVEPASGSIYIDEVDICSIGLRDLRTKLSIIPQEPTLFRGSIRSNLDPLGLHSDRDIWEALEKCQLKGTITKLPNQLDSPVSDEGENWSVGQRQLFCLGRALLQRNKVLVLDEATASIDSATDAILQRIIRKEFLDCTVITVAHRVPTVMDSDTVMVLSYGKLLEYDKPSNLMGINSAFSKLVADYWANCRRRSSQNLQSSLQ